MDIYQNVWLYDLVHKKCPAGEQISFYQKQIERFGQPVLELACGTGKFLVPLAQEGFEMMGLDFSEKMLDQAKRYASEKSIEINLIKGDMRAFNLTQKFGLIFVAGNSFQHLYSFQEIEHCFSSVKRHLKKGGKFIVEVFNPSLRLLLRNSNKRYLVGEFPSDKGLVEINETVKYDAASQIKHIIWHYRFKHFDTKEKTVSFQMRQFFPLEFDYLFTKNGFRIEQKFGDFDESAFSKNSPKQILILSH